MAYSVSVSHVDTCLPSYLTDHHNREGEALFGVPVDASTTHAELREGLREGINAYSGDIPEDVTDEAIEAAIAECFASAKPEALFDVSLEPRDEDDDGGELCCAWFALEWSEEEDEEEDEDGRERFEAGERVRVVPTPEGIRESGPAAAWLDAGEQIVTLNEDACAGGWDVYGVTREDGSEETIYGFNIAGRA